MRFTSLLLASTGASSVLAVSNLHKRAAKAAAGKRESLRNLQNIRKNMSLRGLKKDRFYQQDSATNWDLVSTRIGSPASSISSFDQNNGSTYSPPYDQTYH